VTVVAALGLALLAGCFRISTTTVRVTDPAAVSVRFGPREVLPPSSQPAATVVGQGHYWYLLTRLPYRIDAVREPLGAVTLRCDACAFAPWPMVATAAVPLVDAAGNVRPSFATPRATREALFIPVDVGFVRAPRRMQAVVGARPELVIPWRAVASARRVSRPLPWWFAAVATGVGATWVGLGGYFIHATRHDSDSLRYGVSVPVIAVGAAVLALGLWHLLAPVREETLQPPP
jgi:hypothetical protein